MYVLAAESTDASMTAMMLFAFQHVSASKVLQFGPTHQETKLLP